MDGCFTALQPLPELIGAAAGDMAVSKLVSSLKPVYTAQELLDSSIAAGSPSQYQA